MKAKTDREKGIASLIVLSLVFASMGIFVRYLQSDFTLLQQTYLRIGAAFIISFIVFYKDLHFHKLKLLSRKDWFLLALRSISLYLLGVVLLSQAYLETKYSNVSFIGALPVAAVFGFLFFKEKVTTQKILYLIIGFLGVVLIAVKDYSHLLQWGQGELLAFIATIFFSLSYVTRKWQGNVLNNKEIAVLIFFISTILLLVTSLFIDKQLPHGSSFSYFVIPIILLSGSFNVINLVLTNYGFQKIEAVLASNLLMLESIFAVLLGFAFYRELPDVKAVIGAVLILLSAYQMNKQS